MKEWEYGGYGPFDGTLISSDYIWILFHMMMMMMMMMNA